ncbi:zinc finger protein ZFP2-like [Physella acuta]|uniref:zinc finger protein ZFP2-like n=1 Tax=Physella acuta TaxID=109671 RepID=UPI0027DEA22A|nr:zinc finger protein ZFP2-like [Physella acuta]XP_059167539.1 zinc finger protein ZFP2-like [Physella acuta]
MDKKECVTNTLCNQIVLTPNYGGSSLMEEAVLCSRRVQLKNTDLTDGDESNEECDASSYSLGEEDKSADGDVQNNIFHQVSFSKEDYFNPDQVIGDLDNGSYLENTSHLDDMIDVKPDAKSLAIINTLPSETVLFRCCLCNLGFNDAYRMTLHIGQHSGVAVFPCEECDMKFLNSRSLTAHRKLHAGGNLNNFSPVKEISVNKKFHLPIDWYRCTTCGQRFQYKNDYLSHLLMHGERPHKCRLCSKTYRSASGLRNHVQTHKNKEDKFFRCFICYKVFKENSSLNSHLVTHSEDKPHLCHLCGQAFKWKNGLSKHMLVHTKVKRYKCELCGTSFNRLDNMKLHLVTHIKPFTCSLCGKNYSSKYSIDLHLSSHSGEQILRCAVCDKVFYHEEALLLHAQSHTSKEVFKCRYCLAVFKQNIQLKNHLKTHSFARHLTEEVKRYKCRMCTLVFTDENDLLAHKEIHLIERPFRCEICGKAFPWRKALNDHKRCHAPKKYKCDFCDFMFRDRYSLTRHIRTHPQQ